MSSTLLPAHERALARATRIQRAIHALRSEGDSRGRESAAVGTGLLIGCTPFWGTHFFLCWGAGWLLRLNRLKIYLAANLINPLVLVPLLYAEVQTGAWLRRGQTLALSREALVVSPWQFGGDLVLGSLVVGMAVGLVGALVTFAARRPTADPFYRQLTRRAADRYIDAGITAWEFARGKLSGDPVYRHALEGPLAGATGTLVDLGCGQGLMLALVAEAQATARAGHWLDVRPPAPAFDRLMGIETRPRVAGMAVRALHDEADVRTGDIRVDGVPRADVVLLFDVLHMVPVEDQAALLRAVHDALPAGGRLYVREADASAGWRFTMVRLGNRLKALVTRNWRQTFAFRTPADWLTMLEATGFAAEVVPMGAGTPFGNVLLLATRRD
jgi:uncharacterized protein (DUF2062 family)/2-polyprenyl-3-methyl-5-hydroxy-6-metoxy-1,4-benzoquinol methylase